MASEIEDQQRYYVSKKKKLCKGSSTIYVTIIYFNNLNSTQNMVNSSKMGDLDINLITLYARTPALYDKRNPFYKDKHYSERGS